MAKDMLALHTLNSCRLSTTLTASLDMSLETRSFAGPNASRKTSRVPSLKSASSSRFLVWPCATTRDFASVDSRRSADPLRDAPKLFALLAQCLSRIYCYGYREGIAPIHRHIDLTLQTQVEEGRRFRQDIDAIRQSLSEHHDRIAKLEVHIGDVDNRVDQGTREDAETVCSDDTPSDSAFVMFHHLRQLMSRMADMEGTIHRRGDVAQRSIHVAEAFGRSFEGVMRRYDHRCDTFDNELKAMAAQGDVIVSHLAHSAPDMKTAKTGKQTATAARAAQL